MTGAAANPAGWYPDPWRTHEERFWNGHEWTNHARGNGDATGVGPAQARQVASGLARWQYRLVSVGAEAGTGRLGVVLSYFGERGWELVSVFDRANDALALFKRPVADGESPDGGWTEHWTYEQVQAAYQRERGPAIG